MVQHEKPLDRPGKAGETPPPGAAEERRETAVFVLRYDEELTFLANEGVLRPGLQPSGLK